MLFIEYLRLTAPRITLLVMLSGFIGLWIGSRGGAEPSMVFWSLIGIGLASAGASVFNNYYDKDIDSLMERTLRRPLPSGKMKPRGAFIFGVCLSVAAFLTLIVFVSPATAFLAIFAIFIYSFLYTVILKRHTPLATEIGGISGALPPVIGWVAARGGIGLEALILFAMMFLWQPPHFWSLALRYKNDYKRAGIPTIPVVMSERNSKLRSFIYILAMVTVSFMPYMIDMAGRLYLMVALLLGVGYILLSLMGMFSRRDWNKLIFYYSIIYISLSFIFMIIDIQR